jgi:hypothetical protein
MKIGRGNRYWEKTYSSATLSTTKSHMTDPVSNPGPYKVRENFKNLPRTMLVLFPLQNFGDSQVGTADDRVPEVTKICCPLVERCSYKV